MAGSPGSASNGFPRNWKASHSQRTEEDAGLRHLMNEAQFWHLIAKSQRRGSDCDEQAEQLCGLLALLEPDEIGDFKRHFDRHRVQAYRWDLWAVAYILDGGCSEDRFDYFCCWLIGRGQKA